MAGPRTKGQAPAEPAILVRLDEADYLMIAELAELDGNSLSGYLRTLIRRHLTSLTLGHRFSPELVRQLEEAFG